MMKEQDELISRILVADDRHAFRQLVLLHQSSVRVFLRRALGDAALADDCAQEAWLTVYQKLGTFRGGSFRAWVFAIAIRKAQRMKVKSGRIEEWFDDNQDTAVPTAPIGLKLDLEKALQRLSLPERSCLHLSGSEELSHEEIADVLRLPLGTVKSHLSRGKEKLRRMLGAEEERGRDHV